MYSLDELIGLDLDWFATDDCNQIAHFASGGGIIPDTVLTNEKEMDYVYNFFIEINILNIEYGLSDATLLLLKNDSKAEKERYLQSFKIMSQRGLFSYDKCDVGNFNNRNYQLATYPIKKIDLLSIPEDVINILNRTRISGDFNKMNFIGF